jgi:hypothetical protein
VKPSSAPLWSTGWGFLFLVGFCLSLVAGGIVAALIPGMASLDETTLAAWLAGPEGRDPARSAWLWGVLVFAGGVLVNGVGCLIVFLRRKRPGLTRAAFLLLHVGSLLLPAAYLAGSLLGGAREKGVAMAEGSEHRLASGESLTVSGLDAVFTPQGRPVDVRFTATLTGPGERRGVSQEVRFNRPLISGGTMVYAESFDYRTTGLALIVNGSRMVVPPSGRLVLDERRMLLVLGLLTDYTVVGGRAQRGPGLGRSPAVELGLVDGGGMVTRGWYLSRDPGSSTFKAAGITVSGAEVLADRTAIVTIARDRFWPLAAFAASLFLLGLAANIVLFYRRYGRLRTAGAGE